MRRQHPAIAPERVPSAPDRGSAVDRFGAQARLAGALLALAAGAWVATDLRMAGMDAGPGTDPGALGFYLGIWAVMMVAMMLPAVTPVVLARRESQHRDHAGPTADQARETALFLGGYLAVWIAAGLLAYAVLAAGRSLDGGLFAWGHDGRWLAAGVLAGAALYQVTAFKSACLSRCRGHRLFLLRDGHEGRRSAQRLGIAHGLWCLGCCWGLMAALFALGAMSLAWMVLISVLIAAERLLPWRAPATVAVASLLAALAIGVAVAPARVPLLTLPGSSAAASAMHAMHAMPSSARMPRPAK